MNRQLNYSSDFDFALNLLDAEGNSVGWLPDANWQLTLYTVREKFTYVASYAYGKKTNCLQDNGNIRIVVDNHQFPVGELKAEIRIDIPNSDYPDGYRHSEAVADTGIEIVADNGNEASGIVVNISVPNLVKPDVNAGEDSSDNAASEGDSEQTAV